MAVFRLLSQLSPEHPGPWGAWRADSCPPRKGQLAILARYQESECCGLPLGCWSQLCRAILQSGFELPVLLPCLSHIFKRVSW